ncbi:MAG: ferredoxin-thioredoxin reductase catalytic domain-containing protein [Candidatus Margulisiibacteriota bacterium]
MNGLFETLDKAARSAGYFLNPDKEFVLELCDGLLKNKERYGYIACPCRLASGVKKEDLDIICPCDYRDSDIEEYGTCYCGLYVSKEIAEGKKKISSIPERRPLKEKRQNTSDNRRGRLQTAPTMDNFPLPVWRCKVCGYLCARNEPPGICPICKAEKDRFERFIW